MVFIKERFLALVSLFVSLLTLPAAAQTANESVRPYTEPFTYGANIGYYGTAWTDESLAGIAQKLNAHSVRPTLPERFVERYGYNIRLNTFNAYVNQLGMKEITCFIEKPSDAHLDPTTYPGCSQPSKLFAHLYEPIWNADGTVNTNNYYAIYVYRLLQTYGDKVRFWEVVNEPDFSYTYDKSVWLTRAPNPAELVNAQAPIYHYIRMLRITYEVVKKYRPDEYVTTGGVGYTEYVDALLRYTDNPNGGAVSTQYPRTGGAYFDVLSFHNYPSYDLHYWDTSIAAFRYTRTSDYAANKVISFKDKMVGVLTKYGYNGVKYPKKLLLMTESNIARRTSDDRYGTDEMQRNFGIKALVLTQKNDIKQFYYYSLGESINAPATTTTVSGSDEIKLMGLYENLNRDAPGAQKTTQLGKAFATTSQLLYGYRYDAARTAALALPANVDGAAFSKNGGYIYVLWAKTLTDKSEYATATYSLPATLNTTSVQRIGWDYSATGTKTTQSTQGMALTGTPTFFVADGSLTAVAPAPAPITAPISTTCSATNQLLREEWANLTGSTIASIPISTLPTTKSMLTQFEATSTENSYGARLRGYLCPPTSGAYTFYITGDDFVELWLSPDDSPATKVRIATCTGWLSSMHDWTEYPSQKSAAIQLVAGKRYYIEALHKQNWGAGFVSVAWRLPNNVLEGPIGGNRLSPFIVSTTSSTAAKTTASALMTSPTAVTDDAIRPETAKLTELTAFPNPFSQQTTVQFSLAAAGSVRLEVFDLQGRLVRQLFSGQGEAGDVKRLTFDAQDLSRGLYILRLTTGTQVLNQKLALEK